MKRKTKQTEEQKVNVGDSVVYFAQTYTVVETDEFNLHIKCFVCPFNSLWVRRSDVSVTKGECNES